MPLSFALIASAIYLGLIGLALIFAPLQFGIGAVPADASPELIAFLRLVGGPLLGIAFVLPAAKTSRSRRRTDSGLKN